MPSAMKKASAPSWIASYWNRWPANSSGRASSALPPTSGSKMPGQSSTTLASSAQNVQTALTRNATPSPPGTLYGRGTCGCDRRSRYSAGKIEMYEIVVVEIARPSAATKYLPESPLVNVKAATKNTVEITPEARFTAIGVPQRPEKVPSQRGPQPS